MRLRGAERKFFFFLCVRACICLFFVSLNELVREIAIIRAFARASNVGRWLGSETGSEGRITRRAFLACFPLFPPFSQHLSNIRTAWYAAMRAQLK